MSKVKQDAALVEAIKKSYSDPSSGAMVSEGNVFNEHLPLIKTSGEETLQLTPEIITGVNDYVCKFSAAGVESAGDIALAAMKKDKKLDIVTAELPLGAFGRSNIAITREKEISIPSPEKGGTATTQIQYGSARLRVDFVAGRNSGLLGQAKAAIRAEATSLFGPKEKK